MGLRLLYAKLVALQGEAINQIGSMHWDSPDWSQMKVVLRVFFLQQIQTAWIFFAPGLKGKNGDKFGGLVKGKLEV